MIAAAITGSSKPSPPTAGPNQSRKRTIPAIAARAPLKI